MPAFAGQIGATQVHSGSVGNKVALLLLGEADVYAHRKGLKEWDTCAPELVARALGWSVSRLGGADLVYNQPDPRVDEFLVCRPASRDRVLAALRSSGAAVTTT
jgi:3'(2'), 5'-bisphosphate nucleotidase